MSDDFDDETDIPEVLMSITFMAQVNILVGLEERGLSVTFVGPEPEKRDFITTAQPVTMNDEFLALPVDKQKNILRQAVGAAVTQYIKEAVQMPETQPQVSFPQTKASA